MLHAATLSCLRSLLSSLCACSSLLSSHAWVPALNASLQSCPFTRVFVRRHSDCIENLRSRLFDAVTGFFQIFELPCRANYHFPPPGGSNQRKTIVNSWVRCLENSQTVIKSCFPQQIAGNDQIQIVYPGRSTTRIDISVFLSLLVLVFTMWILLVQQK